MRQGRDLGRGRKRTGWRRSGIGGRHRMRICATGGRHGGVEPPIKLPQLRDGEQHKDRSNPRGRAVAEAYEVPNVPRTPGVFSSGLFC